MPELNHTSTERSHLRAVANREELAERIAHAVSEDGRVEPMEGLALNRVSAPSGPLHAVSRPCLCIMSQGAKEVHLGERRHRYDPFHFLLVTAELPLIGHVVEASADRPYLSLRLDLDPNLVSSVMVEAGHFAPRDGADVRALVVSELGPDLLDAAVRLVRLLDAPDEVSVLRPMIVREIIYRLLQGEQSDRLGHIAVLNGQRHRIAKAIRRLNEEFDKMIRIEDLADELGMSESSFYNHFKAVTDMTPLQFQKQLRLQEARRLMLSEDLNASTAGYQVGYEDPSHFSREYRRHFGAPPMRDVDRLREAAGTA